MYQLVNRWSLFFISEDIVDGLRAGHKTYENALCLMIQQSKMDNVPYINVSDFSKNAIYTQIMTLQQSNYLL